MTDFYFRVCRTLYGSYHAKCMSRTAKCLIITANSTSRTAKCISHTAKCMSRKCKMYQPYRKMYELYHKNVNKYPQNVSAVPQMYPAVRKPYQPGYANYHTITQIVRPVRKLYDPYRKLYGAERFVTHCFSILEMEGCYLSVFPVLAGGGRHKKAFPIPEEWRKGLCFHGCGKQVVYFFFIGLRNVSLLSACIRGFGRRIHLTYFTSLAISTMPVSVSYISLNSLLSLLVELVRCR